LFYVCFVTHSVLLVPAIVRRIILAKSACSESFHRTAAR
jgi:hypothetical protein